MRSFVPILALLMFAAAPSARASDDLVLPSDLYTSPKARRLATTHANAVRDLGTTLYHCLPWLEVQRHSVGFFKPKHATTDDRYLSVRVFVDQQASQSFAALARDERAAAMFSRYVGHLLRRMARSQPLLEDPDVAGFSVIVEWAKQGTTVGGRPVHETIAVFITRQLANDYLIRRIGLSDLARKSQVFGFDGETGIGEMRLAVWDDDFASTFQVKGYHAPANLDCRAQR
jgi:hypothetical protein